jgi:hypothetical protein
MLGRDRHSAADFDFVSFDGSDTQEAMSYG